MCVGREGGSEVWWGGGGGESVAVSASVCVCMFVYVGGEIVGGVCVFVQCV